MAEKQTVTEVSGGVTLRGEADLGRATSDKKWKITKTEVAGGTTTVKFPVGANGYPSDSDEFSWDERAALNFSFTPDTTAPTLTTVTIASDNSDTAKAKVGDTVTVSIIGSEFLTEVAATINGNAATVVEGVDDKHFEASYVMASGDTEGAVTFSVSFKDIAGRAGTPVTAVTDASAVTFDKTAPTATILYSVDAGANYYSSLRVKDADTLRIKATFSEPLLDAPVVKLAIDNAILAATNMVKTSTTVYTYDLNVPVGNFATATCSLSVGTDASGNVVTAAPANATFTVDNTAPTLSSAARGTDTQITVTLSELALASTITKANDGGFVVSETGTPATTYAVSAIAPGATDDLVVLTVADMAASALAGVTVTYVAAVNGTVSDVAGNLLATDATGVVVAAW